MQLNNFTEFALNHDSCVLHQDVLNARHSVAFHGLLFITGGLYEAQRDAMAQATFRVVHPFVLRPYDTRQILIYFVRQIPVET